MLASKPSGWNVDKDLMDIICLFLDNSSTLPSVRDLLCVSRRAKRDGNHLKIEETLETKGLLRVNITTGQR